MSFSDQEKINLSLKKALNIIQTSTDTYHGNEVIKEKKYSESKTILKHSVPPMSVIQNYYVIGKTVNTFKLSHTNSHMGDAAAISLTGVGEGSDHKFT